MTAKIEVVDRTGLERTQALVAGLIEAVLKAEGVSGAVSVALVDEQEMTALNQRHRGLPEPTDVLSFRYADDDAEWPADLLSEPAGVVTKGGEQPALDLGELIVCPAVVDRYARDEGAEFGVQLAWTLIHGTLHLVGYDHETDDGEMRRREQILLREFDSLARALSASRDH